MPQMRLSSPVNDIHHTSQEGLNSQALTRVQYELETSLAKFDLIERWLQEVHASPEDGETLKGLENLKTSFETRFDAISRHLSRLQNETRDLGDPLYTDELPSELHVLEPPPLQLSHCPQTPAPAPAPLSITVPTTPPAGRSRKRPLYDIIGPSPEKRAQKRHDSHGVF